jgi:hypothetical protein
VEELRTLAREMLEAFEEEAGLDLIELANNMNALVARMSREDDGGLKKRALTAEEQADRTMRKLRQLALAVRDYLTTKDPAQLPGVRALIQEIEGAENRILN